MTLIPIFTSSLLPTSYNGAAMDMRNYGTIIITCTVAPSVAYTINTSPDNATYLVQNATANTSSGVTNSSTISAVGTYTLTGLQYVELTGGTGGTFFIAGGWG